jgi:hypothetical protein
MIALGILMVALFFVIKNKTIKIPRQLIYFFTAIIIAGIIILFQGGVITGIFQQWIAKTNLPQLSDESYQNVAFFLSFPPAVVDAQLGILSLFNPLQLFVLILEIGPMLLLLWPALIWGFKAVRGQRWFEAILVAMVIVSLGLAFFQISLKAGSIGSITRAQNYFTVILKIFAIPFLFIWLANQTEKIKIFTSLLIAITLLGGIVIFGLELIAIQKPILSMDYVDLDAKIMREYWNKLDIHYMVFDPHPIRSVVLFGHATDASIDWFTYKPDWEVLVNNPDPMRLKEAGYGYFYTDQSYLRSLPAIVTQRIGSSCVKVMADYKDDFGAERILMDIRGCQ